MKEWVACGKHHSVACSLCVKKTKEDVDGRWWWWCWRGTDLQMHRNVEEVAPYYSSYYSFLV
jgi:hypothetical protein